jgi:hypothetical protein
MISIVSGVICFLGRPTFFPTVGIVLVVLYWVELSESSGGYFEVVGCVFYCYVVLLVLL